MVSQYLLLLSYRAWNNKPHTIDSGPRLSSSIKWNKQVKNLLVSFSFVQSAKRPQCILLTGILSYLSELTVNQLQCISNNSYRCKNFLLNLTLTPDLFFTVESVGSKNQSNFGWRKKKHYLPGIEPATLTWSSYTLSHPENDRDFTERIQEYTLQDASFMRQSRCSFLNTWENTQVAHAMTSVFLRNTRGET